MNRDRILGVTFLCIAALYGFLGRDLIWLANNRPGAGFFPLIITTLLTIAAFSMLFRPDPELIEMPPREDTMLIARALGIVSFAIVIMPYAGYLISTLLLLAFVWLPADDPIRRRMRLFLVVTVTAVTYLLFIVLLGMQLPKSALGF